MNIKITDPNGVLHEGARVPVGTILDVPANSGQVQAWLKFDQAVKVDGSESEPSPIVSAPIDQATALDKLRAEAEQAIRESQRREDAALAELEKTKTALAKAELALKESDALRAQAETAEKAATDRAGAAEANFAKAEKRIKDLEKALKEAAK